MKFLFANTLTRGGDNMRGVSAYIRDIKKELGPKAIGMEYLEAFLRYIISAAEKITEQEILITFFHTGLFHP